MDDHRHGPVSGSTIRASDGSEDAPSVRAASSSSFATPSMTFFISPTANGSLHAATKKIVPCAVSFRFLRSPRAV
ncbi:hypothetical protein GCM10010243_00090 [Streptomyces matensis]|nr:hypothetical protein GCM10010243_00090 [Streptomyces matensis]